jgi:two-component system sensor kinase FixL
VLLNPVLNGMGAVGPASEGRRLVLRTRQADAAVRVVVRDEGPGIPAETLPRLFETFYTTKPTGMGMGLEIIRCIVEAHGGRISTENNPDRRAASSFRLPVCPPDSLPASTAVSGQGHS